MKHSPSSISRDQIAKVAWSDDLPVYEHSETSNSSIAGEIPRLGDDVWPLDAVQWKPTSTTRSFAFRQFSREWKGPAKRIAWCMLNIEAPIDLIQRPNATRKRLSKASVISNMEVEIRPFLLWLNDQNISCLSEVTEQILRKYGDDTTTSSLTRIIRSRKAKKATSVIQNSTRIGVSHTQGPSNDGRYHTAGCIV